MFREWNLIPPSSRKVSLDLSEDEGILFECCERQRLLEFLS
jgi:hypothetical protein